MVEGCEAGRPLPAVSPLRPEGGPLTALDVACLVLLGIAGVMVVIFVVIVMVAGG